VLETALDTTKPGLARAIVSRDVRGFDGSQVLVPRGSRLIGEYQSDVASGQRRALIRWTRLIRPDGVTVALQSPSADTLGRAGVKGKVNSHFLERYGGAILQSALNVGMNVATSKLADGTYIVGWPGVSAPSTAPSNGANVRSTVTVKQGASVSVFVARDLDFSSIDERQ
jgi:type IV secretion system protein VirB10